MFRVYDELPERQQCDPRILNDIVLRIERSFAPLHNGREFPACNLPGHVDSKQRAATVRERH